MKHLNTSIKINENANKILDYLLGLGCNNSSNMNGTAYTCYYVNSNNSIQCGEKYLLMGKLFNSIEEHKAYMKQSKSIAIW